MEGLQIKEGTFLITEDNFSTIYYCQHIVGN